MKGVSKGVQFNDRVLAGNLRTRAMQEILLVVNEDKKVKKWSAYKKTMLLTLAKSILPRLQEHTGEDGSAIVIEFSEVLAKKHGVNARSNGNSARQQ